MLKKKELLRVVENRFKTHMFRHEGIRWIDVERKFRKNFVALRALASMEETGGEPDVIGFDSKTGEHLIVDCSVVSPVGRRSLCYDPQAVNDRKTNKPRTSALGLAMTMGIQLLTERQYRRLQQLGSFDMKTSSWIATPPDIRKRGGALFCDRRYDAVFVYHNGAESYYASRGFRGLLRV